MVKNLAGANTTHFKKIGAVFLIYFPVLPAWVNLNLPVKSSCQKNRLARVQVVTGYQKPSATVLKTAIFFQDSDLGRPQTLKLSSEIQFLVRCVLDIQVRNLKV